MTGRDTEPPLPTSIKRCARLTLAAAVFLYAWPGAAAEHTPRPGAEDPEQQATSGPLVTLHHAVQLAQKHSERFLIATEELERAKLLRDRAWAAFLPVLTVRGTLTHSDKEIGFSSRVIQRQRALAGNASARLTLFDGPAIPQIARAYALADAAEQRTRWQHEQLAFEVANAYFSALAASNMVGVAERSLRTAEKHLVAARARRAAGEALGIDETRARIQVVSSRSELVRADNALDSAIDYLAYLVGREPPISVQRPVMRLPATDAQGVAAADTAVRRRADVHAAQLQVQAARHAVIAAWMDFLPTVALEGAYRVTQNTGWSGDPDSWNVLLALQWALFDGGLRRTTVRERDSLLIEARLQRQMLERGVRREVRQALRDLKTAHATLQTAQEKLNLAKQSETLIMTRYRSGLATSLEVVEAADTLKQAEASAVAEELGLSLTQLQLLRNLGLSPHAGQKQSRSP
jgi:outer membrane protein